MKPVKLEMCNAGPFKREKIDFTNLENMFLVCGNTGAGKTSIFDAITFALYGKLNGTRSGVNGAKDFFSTYAEKNGGAYEDGYVIFKFELFGKTYQITRTIPHPYTKKNGEVDTTNSTLEFGEIDNDGILFNYDGKKTELEEKIKNLVGFSHEDFSRIVVLPQGQFSEFLKQKSSARKETLSKLFDVESYKAIVEDVKNQLAEKKQKISSLEIALENLTENFDPEGAQEKIKKCESEISKAQIELDKKKEEENKSIAQKSKLEDAFKIAKKNEENKKRLEELEAQKNSAEKNQKTILLANEALSYNGLIENEKNAKNEFDLIVQKQSLKQKELLQNQKNLDALNQKKEKIESAKNSLQKKSIKLEKLKEQKESAKKIFDSKNNFQKISQDCEKQKQTLSQIQSKIDFAKNDFFSLCKMQNENGIEKEFENQKEKKQNAKEEFQKKKDIFEKAKENDELQKAICKLKSDFEKAQADFETKKNLAKSAETQIEELENFRKQNEIQNACIILKNQLKQNSPCPICGSKDHPNPFVAKTIEIDIEAKLKEKKEQLKINKEAEKNSETLCVKLETQIKEKSERKKNYESATISLQDAEKDFNFAKENFFQMEELEKKLSEIKNRYDVFLKEENFAKEKASELQMKAEKAKTEFDTLKKAAGFEEGKEPSQEKLDLEVQKLSEEIKFEKNEIDSFEKEFKIASEKNSSLKSVLNEIAENVSSAQKKFDSSKSNLQNAISNSKFKSLEECISAMLEKSQIEKLQAQVDAWKKEYDKYQVLTSEQSDCEKSEVIQNKIKMLEEKLRETKQKIDALNKNLFEWQTQKKELQKKCEDYKKIFSDLQALQKECLPYETLFNDLSQRNPKGISFDTWVLAYYFSEVVSYANKRFYEISQGRYEFKISEQSGGGGYKGLDLLVTDSYTGIERDTSTLSGGETFMASISLALALTDVVQNRNGGIQLDSIFIDEGFGTLDEETLNCAMGILNDLQETKMVGIISHIESMRTQIPSHIEVQKTMTGSHIKIV